MFLIILRERKKRELDPTLAAPARMRGRRRVRQGGPRVHAQRLHELIDFMELTTAWRRRRRH